MSHEIIFSIGHQMKFCFLMILRFLQALEPFYERFDSDFVSIRTKAREVLQREDDLNEIVQVPLLACVHVSCLYYVMAGYGF